MFVQSLNLTPFGIRYENPSMMIPSFHSLPTRTLGVVGSVREKLTVVAAAAAVVVVANWNSKVKPGPFPQSSWAISAGL